jgi:hypothetical protein
MPVLFTKHDLVTHHELLQVSEPSQPLPTFFRSAQRCFINGENFLLPAGVNDAEPCERKGFSEEMQSYAPLYGLNPIPSLRL